MRSRQSSTGRSMLTTIDGVLREPPPSSMMTEPSGRASAARSAEMKTGTPEGVFSTRPREASVSLARWCSSSTRRSGRSKPSEHQMSSAW